MSPKSVSNGSGAVLPVDSSPMATVFCKWLTPGTLPAALCWWKLLTASNADISSLCAPVDAFETFHQKPDAHALHRTVGMLVQATLAAGSPDLAKRDTFCNSKFLDITQFASNYL